MLGSYAHIVAFCAIVCALVSCAPLCSSAQDTPYSLEITKTVDTTQPGILVEVSMYVRNESSGNLPLWVTRTKNVLPDTTYRTTICYAGTCWPDTMSSPPPLEIPPGESMLVHLTFAVGSKPCVETAATLEFTTAFGGNLASRDFSVWVTGCASVDDGVEARASRAYPNPARSEVRLDAPGATAGANLRLYDAAGKEVKLSYRVAAGTSGNAQIIVDTRALPNGPYRYLLSVARRRYTGGFVVAR